MRHNIYIVVLLFVCSCSSNETNPIKPLDYNNKLIGLWQKAQTIDQDFDKAFYSNYFSYHHAESPEFIKFVDEQQSKLIQLKSRVNTVDDMPKSNGMKEAFLESLDFLEDNYVDLYIRLITNKNNKIALSEIISSYNKQFSSYQQKFIAEQKKLLQKHQLEIENK